VPGGTPELPPLPQQPLKDAPLDRGQSDDLLDYLLG